MSDQELDSMMCRVLLDAMKLEWDEQITTESSFEPSAKFRREMRSMLKNPLRWERRKSHPIWKTGIQRAAAVLVALGVIKKYIHREE